MRGGQNRLPTEVKDAKGTLQPCRANPDEPKLESTPVPDPPGHLRADEKKAWVELAPKVDELGVYTDVDLHQLELTAMAVAYHRRIARDRMASPNQILAARRDAAAQLAAFGLSPQSRARVKKAPAAEVEDELSEFDA